MKSASVTVGTTAIALAKAGSGGEAEVLVSLADSDAIVIGGSDVTATTGVTLTGPGVFPIRLGARDTVYAIVATGTVDAGVSIAQLGFE